MAPVATENRTASDQSAGLAGDVNKSALNVSEQINELQNRLTRALRASAAGNRRNAERKVCTPPIATQVTAGKREQACEIKDISVTGAEISTVQGVASGERLKIKLGSVGTVEAEVRRVTSKSCGLQFINPPMEKIAAAFGVPMPADYEKSAAA